jgi:hypothetical protein
MNMTKDLQIRIIVQSHVLDKSTITMQIKHCNRLFSKTILIQIIIL